ncbi:Stf0 family sulfotransferase [Pseudoruegeria sp. HB172150]|uniref:Stf0 family sulfotransferase n=1 Tax=Pseudoruegeria sp. HB172150 TaxID=2721164 RepID=UPI001555C1F9|nr:Stf0 family sulfotransferase [Pseudoruegeria sp. HB172150]
MLPRPKRSYVLCTAPRSGSTLLCGMLEATNAAGRPNSHFHTPSLDRWLEVYDLNPASFTTSRDAVRAVFEAALARGMGETDIFGLRMQRGSFDFFLQQLGLLVPGRMSDAGRIEKAFGPTLFIHLSRQDRLDQAISRVRAEQSGLWHRRSDGTELERLAPGQEPRYDPDSIAFHMKDLAALDEAWEEWFRQEALEPLRIRYDDLSETPRKVLAQVLSALDLDPVLAQSVEIPTAKLADAQSRQWRERFEAEHPVSKD